MNRQLSVIKLTAITRNCHKPDARRVRRAGIVGLVLLFTLSNVWASNWQAPKDIAAAAEDYLRTRVESASSARNDSATTDMTFTAQSLDARIKLAACDQPLTGFLRSGTKISARTVVGVRCKGSKPWKVYVPVDMTVNLKVWVASKPLPRGHIIGAGDVVAEVRNVSRQSGGYMSARQNVFGQKLRNSILAGRIIEPRLVEADNMIKRGQTVTLAVKGTSINIRMSGKALTDGAINQRIRVENQNSGRVVEGIVRSRELVEILMPGTASFPDFSPKVSPQLADTGFNNNDS